MPTIDPLYPSVQPDHIGTASPQPWPFIPPSPLVYPDLVSQQTLMEILKVQKEQLELIKALMERINQMVHPPGRFDKRASADSVILKG